MIVRQERAFGPGYTAITDLETLHPEILLDFGILKLAENERVENSEKKERAILLINGKVRLQWEGHSEVIERRSCFDEGPIVLHLPESVPVVMTGLEEGSELGIEQCLNGKAFDSRLYRASDCREDVFGQGTMQEASTRTVRTVFDGETAPYSNMVMGEVITHPGKWSSYPPHDHPHPEIYHYRFQPEQGFGAAFLDYDSHTIRDRDTCLILPDKTHSQVAAAGYAMWYVWMIPHIPGDRWKPSTRYFRKEHEWLLKEDAHIWAGKEKK